MLEQKNLLNHIILKCFCRVTGYSQTVIDNIFSNYISKEAGCGNITSTISYHLPQLLFIPSMSFNLLRNLTYLKEAGETSIKLNLSWITIIKIGVTS